MYANKYFQQTTNCIIIPKFDTHLKKQKSQKQPICNKHKIQNTAVRQVSVAAQSPKNSAKLHVATPRIQSIGSLFATNPTLNAFASFRSHHILPKKQN